MLPSKYSLLQRVQFCLVCSFCVGFTGTHLAQQAFADNQLVTFEQASKNGLQRAWFAQARVDSARNRVAHWTLSENELFALTTSSTVHAVHAETGRTLWIAQVGNPDFPSVGPVTNSNRIAILNGSNLYLLDRKDGHVLWTRNVGHAASAAPILSETFAYVASINGRIEGFPLGSATGDAWQFQSIGRIFHSPAATGQFVAWPTSRGYLYVGNADQSKVFFRIQTNEEIIAAPAEWGSSFYIASLNGYLYSYDGSTGNQHWRYSTGMPIISKPVVIDDKIFVASELPALHAVDAATGNRLWTVEGAVQFVTQAEHYIYAADIHGNLLILNKETGNLAGQLPTGEGVYPIVNEQSDRIFLASDAGLIQCLHEIGANQPTYHRAKIAAQEEQEKPSEAQPGSDASPADSTGEEENPFVDEEAPADESASPFGGEETTEEESDDDNPFAF